MCSATANKMNTLAPCWKLGVATPAVNRITRFLIARSCDSINPCIPKCDRFQIHPPPPCSLANLTGNRFLIHSFAEEHTMRANGWQIHCYCCNNFANGVILALFNCHTSPSSWKTENRSNFVIRANSWLVTTFSDLFLMCRDQSGSRWKGSWELFSVTKTSSIRHNTSYVSSRFRDYPFTGLSLPRVINFKLPCSLATNISSHSTKKLAFHSLLRRKTIIQPILTTSPIHSLQKVGRMYFLNVGVEGLKYRKLYEKIACHVPRVSYWEHGRQLVKGFTFPCSQFPNLPFEHFIEIHIFWVLQELPSTADIVYTSSIKFKSVTGLNGIRKWIKCRETRNGDGSIIRYFTFINTKRFGGACREADGCLWVYVKFFVLHVELPARGR